MTEMRREHGGKTGVVLLRKPQRKDAELLIAGKHGIEGGQVPQRLFHDLGACADEDAVYGRYCVAQLCLAICRKQQPKRIFALRLLVEGATHFTQVVYGIVGGFRTRARIEGRGVASAHHTGQHADLEEGNELFLLIDLSAG